MRLDGDRLLAHLAGARRTVLLCAPFIKVGVLSNLLRQVPASVAVQVVTRWKPEEVAVGVSDLEVFDIVAARNGAELKLLDRLHAKLYLADDQALIGSANLTAAALGWSKQPNVELLTTLPVSDEAVRRCLDQLADARPATAEERDRIRELAKGAAVAPGPLAEDVELSAAPSLWLPRAAAPAKLFQAYVPRTRERLTASVLEAALDDLAALELEEGLTETAFKSAVATNLARMPAIKKILGAAADDLTDEGGIEIIRQLNVDSALPPENQWLVVREWLTHFLDDRYEIAPQSFVLRLRPGAGRT